MDQFGVLVESIGFRPHGKSSTPMSQLKPNPKSNFAHRSDASSFRDPYSFSPIVDQLDGIFRSNTQKPNQSQNISVVDDIFGGPLSNNSNSSLDLRNYAGSNGYGDLIGSKSTQKDPVFDDLFGSFGLNASSSNQAKKGSGLDDLIPGFIGASQSKNRIFSPTKSNVRPSNSSSTKIDDPFSIFETSVSRSQSDTSWPFNEPSGQDKGKSSVQSTTNGFNGFLMGGPPKSGSKVGIRTTVANKPSSNGFENAKYVDSIFGSNNAGSTAQNSLFDSLFREEEHAVKQTSSQSSSFSTKNPTSVTSIGDDFTSLFGDVAMSTGEFREIAGEPAERRRARLNRYTKTNERMAEALAEKNQRDLQIQREQEEKRRIAETLDGDIKRWAAGKEGNLRALLASLQQVLGHESGWRPVPLTDLITSESVKKVYKKATLYVHPDKVQQRGANLHQKYIAEKVFDILKEASNKFSAEELR